MRKIEKPNHNPKNVYLVCVSHIKNVSLRDRLKSIADNVAGAADEFDQNANTGCIYQFQQHSEVGGLVSKDEMEDVYTDRMAKKGTSGRRYYDELRASAPLGVCPLCGHRQVSQLDHYLPKANFPSLAVVPYNLVPSCSDCNKEKLNQIPINAESQTLHPYYDDVTGEQWLYAEVIETSPAAMRFFAKMPEVWDSVLKHRIRHHFNTFGLDNLYRSQAAVELANIRGQLISLFDKVGRTAVCNFLGECADSRCSNHINSWQTAMYQAATRSDWFCNGGFRGV